MPGGRRVVVFIFLSCSVRLSLSCRKHTLSDLARVLCVCFDINFIVSGLQPKISNNFVFAFLVDNRGES